ncbi:hypothetical protein MAR_032369 [Mya arenaria]|uniref:Ig-like domain-containing protein n=1 Tax=Mya arenaria TaxID=6604 RepID=A0ABY7F6K4_MYAAR|nr:hypothetical protein MAR_032369 [Mya arenaria]
MAFRHMFNKLFRMEIRPECGNLLLLSSEIKYGTTVEVAYYPSDQRTFGNHPYNKRTWLKGVLQEPLHLRDNIYEEWKMSDYLYTLKIYNLNERKAGRYALKCERSMASATNWLSIHVTLIGPIWDDCVYGNADTTIYCNTSRTSGSTHVTFSKSQEFTMTQHGRQTGVYAIELDVNTWRDHDGGFVICMVSNDAYVHDLKSTTKLCYMEKGSDPILNIPEYIHNENTTISGEVLNTRPPACIEIMVNNEDIIDAVQENLLNESSKTFANGPVVDIMEELNIEEGSSVSFKCKFSRGNPPQESSVVWTRTLNNQRWEDGSLEITSIQRSDDDIYTCTVTNEMVLSEGKIVNGISSEYTDSVTKAENDIAVLVCVVDSNPKAEISIAKGDEILEVEQYGNNLTHTIASLSCLNAGLYSCTGSVSRPFNGNVTLIFYSPLNENVTLSYIAFAYPIPKAGQFTWKKCIGNETCIVITANSSKYDISTIGLSSYLIITHVLDLRASFKASYRRKPLSERYGYIGSGNSNE